MAPSLPYCAVCPPVCEPLPEHSALSPSSKASKCQADIISIKFNDLQEPPKEKLQLNVSLLPLKRSEPRL